MLKTFKEKAVTNKRNVKIQFWTHENYTEIICSNRFLEQKLTYIHQNPVKAGIVEQAQEYIYSSAKAYADEKGLLEIITIDRKWKTIK
jgi:hypothetical protein